jgi:hypothetical protein
MANRKFACPLCGKIWYTEKDLAACVAKDAAETEKSKSEARRIEACRKSDYNNLMKRKDLIENKYEELRNLVYAYNCEAQTYATKYKQPLSRCDITCTFRTTGGYPWLYNAEATKAKEFSTPAAKAWENELRDIIRKELNF